MAERYRNKESGVVYLVSLDKDKPKFPYKLMRESTGDYFTHATKSWLDEEFTPLDSKPTKNKHKQCHKCYGSGLTQDGMTNCSNCDGLGTFSLASTTDNITKPNHYHSGSVDVIYFLENYFPSDHKVTVSEGFFLANVLKYVSRYKMKGQPLEDLKKARFYLDKLIELESNNGTND